MTRSVQGVATKRGDVRDWETKGTLKVGETDLPSHAALIKRQVERSLERRGGDCGWSTVGLSALLKAVGFRNLRARIVSTDGEFYEHVYAMVGVPKTRSTRLIALDPTVKGATPGWEFSRSRMVQDFIL